MRPPVSELENLMQEWDQEKNDKNPDKVTQGSAYRAHWICSVCSHEWKAMVYSRTPPLNTGCPNCKKENRIQKDSLINFPKLLDEWDFIKNEDMPFEYSAGSGKKVWWICRKGHSWEKEINYRTPPQSNDCYKCLYPGTDRSGRQSNIINEETINKVLTYRRKGETFQETLIRMINSYEYWDREAISRRK